MSTFKTRRQLLRMGLGILAATLGGCQGTPPAETATGGTQPTVGAASTTPTSGPPSGLTPSGEAPATTPAGAGLPTSTLSAEQAELVRQGRLEVRYAPPSEQGQPGLQPLGLGGNRDGLLYVPQSYQPDRPAPLLIMLHGAGGQAEEGIEALRALADQHGLIVLAPESQAPTWDEVRGPFGDDVRFISQALEQIFRRYAINPQRIACAGISDGGTYAFSLGLANGDLFTHVMSFSPGFLSQQPRVGKPRMFLAHGTRDAVFAIDNTSRRFVQTLRDAGYDVRYREFDGPHVLRDEIAREAVEWFVAG